MKQNITQLKRFQPGIYLHYKQHLYEADHLTYNASQNDQLEIHYIGLQLDGAQDGPRHRTREFNEFLFDIVHQDGTKCEHTIISQATCSLGKKIAQRFYYLGPVFEAWMLNADPWQ